jgi:anti-sigma factor RsiW
MSNCREFCATLDAFIDGELAVERAVDAECHMSKCSKCAQRVRFERAFRLSIKQVTQKDTDPSAALQQRMADAIIAERTQRSAHACTSTISTAYASAPPRRSIALPSQNCLWDVEQSSFRQVSIVTATRSSDSSSSVQHKGMMRWRTLLPLAAVAAGAILYAGAHNQTPVSKSWNQVKTSDLKLSELDSYLDMMVSRHLAGKKPRQTMLLANEERLEPPFQLPPIQDVRMVNFGDTVQRPNSSTPVFCGSSSVYQVRGHRVTFCAYEAAAAPLRARLEGYSLRGHVVYAGRRQGYSVATVEDGPVGYAMTSDLSPLESADVIASAVESRVQH